MTAVRATAAAIAAVTAVALIAGAVGSDTTRAAPPERVFAFLSRVEGGVELERLRQVGRRIGVLAPNWYEVDVASASMHEPSGHQPVLDVARRVGVPVWPVVNARTGGSAAIEDPLARERVVDAVVRVAVRRPYAGVTLDIEELLPTQRDHYTALVQAISARLRERGRRLAVYVPRPRGAGSSLAYDLTALAQASDLVLVATYNETGPGGPPGPLDSSAGFAGVLDAAGAVSRDRLVPILGAIGYTWPLLGGPGQMLSTVEAHRRASGCAAPRSVLDGNASFSCADGATHYQTVAGLRTRARAVGAAGFRWFALFSLGREPRSFWEGMPEVKR